MPTPRHNPLRAALSENRLSIGAFQMLADPAVTEILLGGGLEWVLIDSEHRSFSAETVEHLVRTAHGCGPGKSAVVRVRDLTRGAVQYALESGAEGIVVPLVNSAEQAAEAVALTHYPPLGTRGLNAGARAAGWGTADPSGYARAANEQLVVAVQIETVAGLEAVDSIAAVEGVDMLYVGPFDLSHGMGLTGQLGHAEVRKAIARVFEVGRKHRKWLGVLAPDVAFAQWCIEGGVRFLTYRSDVRYLKATVAQEVASLQALAAR